MGDFTKVAIAIVSVGLVATLVVNGVNTAKVVGATTGGFANVLGAAERG
jgi:hypothetical protein